MQHPSDIRSLMAHSLRENALPIGIIALYLCIAVALAHHFRFGLNMSPWVNLVLFTACYILLSGAGLLWVLAKERPQSPLRLLSKLRRRWQLKERLTLAAPMLAAMAVFLPTFSSLKSAIPVMRPYAMDPLFARADVWIHGRPAWELLQPILGHPIVSYLLNCVYHLWLGVFYVSLCAIVAWVGQPELRRRFLIAFLLCWALLGNLAATLLSSVGPCFYGLFYPDDPYVGLMAYLHQADQVFPLAVLDVQAALVEWSHTSAPGLGRGISAMPSLHVSIACLLMLLSLNLGRAWAWAAGLFLLGIVLGSIHLGYHYAVDAYASLIATPAIWWASRPLSAIRGFAAPKLTPSVA